MPTKSNRTSSTANCSRHSTTPPYARSSTASRNARLDYLIASFRQAGLSRTDAQHRARLAYAAYVGFLQLSLQLQQPKQAREDFEAYVEHVIQTLIPG